MCRKLWTGLFILNKFIFYFHEFIYQEVNCGLFTHYQGEAQICYQVLSQLCFLLYKRSTIPFWTSVNSLKTTWQRRSNYPWKIVGFNWNPESNSEMSRIRKLSGSDTHFLNNVFLPLSAKNTAHKTGSQNLTQPEFLGFCKHLLIWKENSYASEKRQNSIRMQAVSTEPTETKQGLECSVLWPEGRVSLPLPPNLKQRLR